MVCACLIVGPDIEKQTACVIGSSQVEEGTSMPVSVTFEDVIEPENSPPSRSTGGPRILFVLSRCGCR